MYVSMPVRELYLIDFDSIILQVVVNNIWPSVTVQASPVIPHSIEAQHLAAFLQELFQSVSLQQVARLA